MAAPVPNVALTVADGALGISELSVEEIPVIVGTSSIGTVNVPIQFTGPSSKSLVDTFGYGPMVELAAYILAQGGKVVCNKTANTVVGTNSAVVFAGTGTSVITVTGTPFDTYDGIMTVLKAGTIGTTGIQIKVSLDGGESDTGTINLGTATTYAIPNTGITLNFAAGTLVLADKATRT